MTGSQEHIRHGWRALLVVVMCLASGCATGGANPAPTSDVSVSSPSATVSSAQAPGEIPHARYSTEIVPPPPLAEYAPYLAGPQPTAEDLLARTQWYTRVQDAIASCMASRGFKYVPLAPDPASWSFGFGFGYFLLQLQVPFLDTDRSVVERNGYGVTGTPEQEAAANGVTPDDDPNLAYKATLSPEEQEAYSRALNGDYTVPTSEGSCGKMAMDANPEPQTSYSDRMSAFDAENGDVIRQMAFVVRNNFFDDARVAALNQQWVECMNGQGYTFDDGTGKYGPQAGLGIAMRTRPDGTLGPSHIGEAVSDIPPDEIRLLGTPPERAVALADFDCRVSTNYMASLTAIRVQIDNDFIAAHGPALLRLKNSQ